MMHAILICCKSFDPVHAPVMHLVLNVAPGELPTLYLAPLNPPHIIQHPLKSTPPPLLSPSILKAEQPSTFSSL